MGKVPTREKNIFYRMDRAAFGVIYGAILVLSILLGMEDKTEEPFRIVVVLFGSVLAIVLSKSFAEAIAYSIETGEPLDRHAFQKGWWHSRASLVTANLPAGLIGMGAVGILSVDLALGISQIYCIFLLTFFGARVGWVVDRRAMPAFLGALFSGGLGLFLGGMKYILH